MLCLFSGNPIGVSAWQSQQRAACARRRRTASQKLRLHGVFVQHLSLPHTCLSTSSPTPGTTPAGHHRTTPHPYPIRIYFSWIRWHACFPSGNPERYTRKNIVGDGMQNVSRDVVADTCWGLLFLRPSAGRERGWGVGGGGGLEGGPHPMLFAASICCAADTRWHSPQHRCLLPRSHAVCHFHPKASHMVTLLHRLSYRVTRSWWSVISYNYYALMGPPVCLKRTPGCCAVSLLQIVVM